jgi:hypothetical protein
LRNLEEIMAERDVHVDHVTIGAGFSAARANSIGVAGVN